MTAPEPERTPAEIAVHMAAMSQQLMDQLELYAKDLQALHTQRSALRVEVRRAQWQAASAEREQERLREQLQERLQQPPPLPPPVEAAPRVLAAPAPGAHAPKSTAWRRLAQHLPAVVGTGVTVAGLGLATGIGVGSPAVPADPLNGPAAVATQIALVTRVALVTQVVPTDTKPDASPTSAAAVAATRPYGAAARPTPATGREPSAAGAPTAAGSPAAAPTAADGGPAAASGSPGSATPSGTAGGAGAVAGAPRPTTGGATSPPAANRTAPASPGRDGAPEATPAAVGRSRRPRLDIDPTDRPPILVRTRRLGPPEESPEAPSRASIGGPKGTPSPAAGPAAGGPPAPARCALDVVVPALQPRTAFVVRVKQEKEDQVVALWPDARGGMLLASGQPPDGSASTSVTPIKSLPSVLLIAEPTELEAAAKMPPGGILAAFLNETDKPIEPSRAILIYFGGTRCP